jgi:hypothetical protein
MKLTYGMLLEQLATLNEEQLAMDVTIYDANTDEVTRVYDFDIVGEEDEQQCRPESDVLDADHPYLVMG